MAPSRGGPQPSKFVPRDPQHKVDWLFRHAARLGFAWRRAKGFLQELPEGEMLLDLHAELLQRIGLQLQPDPEVPLLVNVCHARRDIRDAIAYLSPLAVRTSPREP